MTPFVRTKATPNHSLLTHRRLVASRRVVLFALSLVAAFSFGCSGGDDANGGDDLTSASPLPPVRLRVRVDPVRLEPFAADQAVTGTVRAFHKATITAETQGRVLARKLEPGAAVEMGGVIVALESSRFELEVRRTTASLGAARTVLRHAERELARGDQLMKQKAISSQQHDDLTLAVDRARDEILLAEVARDTAKRNLEDTQIAAPFDGTVDSIEVNVGDFVAPGTPVAKLVDLSRVRIFGGVTAKETARLVPGTKANVSFADLGGEVFEATLESVARVASSGDGTYGIELWMDDPAGKMRDGLVARIELLDADERPTLIARRAALLRSNGYSEVFIVSTAGGENRAETRRVRTGRIHGEWVEILDGLAEGDRVIWDGQFALGEGSVVVIDGEQ